MAGAEVVKASDALTVLLGFGVTVTALTVRGAAAVVDAAAAAVLAADELSSDVHEARTRRHGDEARQHRRSPSHRAHIKTTAPPNPGRSGRTRRLA